MAYPPRSAFTSTKIENITIFNRRRSRLNQLEKDTIAPLRTYYPHVNFHLKAKLDTPDFGSVLQTHLGLADVIFCCTPSTAPLFPFSYLASSPKSRFISAIGSYKPDMKEIDEKTLLCGGRKIFVDSKEAWLCESGELISAGVTSEQLIELGEVLSLEDKQGVLPPAILFSSVLVWVSWIWPSVELCWRLQKNQALASWWRDYEIIADCTQSFSYPRGISLVHPRG